MKPMATKRSNMVRLRGVSMGSRRAWLPSRRSTGTHNGAVSTRRVGQPRADGSTPGRFTRSWTGSYRWWGMELGRCGFQAGAWVGLVPRGRISVGKLTAVAREAGAAPAGAEEVSAGGAEAGSLEE
ncbi:exported hypothetical protein [Frankia sp. AiPs1]